MKEVLIVEDDRIIADLIEMILIKNDYIISGKVRSGEEAINAVASHYPDCVLMDISLAGTLSGTMTAKYLTELFNIPIIFITGCTDQKSIENAITAQPHGLISKPFKALDLTTNVAIAIKNHELRKDPSDFNDRFMRKMMAMLDAVIITDTQGRIILMNPYAERLLGVTWEQIILQPLNRLLILENTMTGEKIDDPVKSIIRESIVIGMEKNVCIVSSMGKKREISLRAQPVTDTKKEIIGIIVIIHEKSYREKKPRQPM